MGSCDEWDEDIYGEMFDQFDENKSDGIDK